MLELGVEEIKAKVKDAIKKQMEVGDAVRACIQCVRACMRACAFLMHVAVRGICVVYP